MNLRWMLAGALILAVCAWFAAQRILWWAVLLSGAMVLAGASSYAIHRMRLPEWDDRPPREARLTLRVDRTFPQSDAKKATAEQKDRHVMAILYGAAVRGGMAVVGVPIPISVAPITSRSVSDSVPIVSAIRSTLPKAVVRTRVRSRTRRH